MKSFYRICDAVVELMDKVLEITGGWVHEGKPLRNPHLCIGGPDGLIMGSDKLCCSTSSAPWNSTTKTSQ